MIELTETHRIHPHTEGTLMDLDDLLDATLQGGVAADVDDLIRRSATALDALRAIHADLVAQHGRDEGFDRLTRYIAKSSLRSAEGAVGVAGLLAILIVKEQDRNTHLEER
jgi:hypothetical protein